MNHPPTRSDPGEQGERLAQETQAAAVDERVARTGPVAQVLARPDLGALMGAIFVFVLFSITARNVHWASSLGIWSNWTSVAAYDGIVAVPVALLMIGGEFDLSAGVMIGSSGLLLGLLTTRADMNVWPAMALVLLFGMAVGFLNGFTVVKTKLPSFIVTLGDVLHPARAQCRRHAEADRHGRDQRHRRRARLRHRAQDLRLDPLEPVRLQRGDHLVDRPHGGGRLGALPHALRQLDLRRRGRPDRGPQRRRPRRADEDRPLHDDLDGRGALGDHDRDRAARRSRPTRASGASSSSSSPPSSAAACSPAATAR